ncbi:hypothetical protein GH714_000714 [Hevea brasiliensis]|uniref:RecQ-mediated genome instability protein 1 n=1 Tax=Hevea brasiliensis TaxID=3981 RepID=A0A6A6LQ91_HEVBR|nr:hypothetical protein GH714_000714 [Hevea brasiliensis]
MLRPRPSFASSSFVFRYELLRRWYQDAPSGVKRCLKLSMTDGLQRVFGMEYRPIKDLQVLASAGLKVVICNVHIRHGLLMLVPEALEVLGGMVDELEAARQLLVNEVNKPPRGKKILLLISELFCGDANLDVTEDFSKENTRSRTGVVPPLATRATLAAWPCNAVNIPGNTNTSVDVHGNTNSSSTVLSHNNDFVNVLGQTNPSVSVHGHANSSDVLDPPIVPYYKIFYYYPSISMLKDISATIVAPGTSRRTTEEFTASMSSGNTMRNSSSSVVSDVEEMHIDASFNRENAVSNVISNHEDVHMVDEFEHPLILSGDREIPFTYLASLSAKWAAMKEKTSFVQGKVKCFLTGVKGFQYKRRTTYELRVYVDDGSLISEILIDHDVVQKGIGHSPEEVIAALSSSDAKRVGDMKETLRQFQIFLVNFEGTMRVEMNRTSPLPVALEMSRGCSASDAWLLMRRLKSSASVVRCRRTLLRSN